MSVAERKNVGTGGSYGQILRSGTVYGSATFARVVISVIKVKVLAVLLGPAGVGLLGLLTSIMDSAAAFGSLGVVPGSPEGGSPNSAVRELAANRESPAKVAAVRRAVLLAGIGLGALSMIVLWLLRVPVATFAFGDAARAHDVGWLGLGVLFSLIAGSQVATLQGLREITALAKVSVASALVSTVAGICIIVMLGHGGVVGFVITVPAATAVIAYFYARTTAGARPTGSPTLAAMRPHWDGMVRLGLTLVASTVLTLFVWLLVRSLIARDLGLEGAGQFQAAWQVSQTYLGFLFGAMMVDYFPRLAQAKKDKSVLGNLINQQTEVGILIAAPALIALIGLAPWVVQLLYTSAFDSAVTVLRWQLMGSVLQLLSRPMIVLLLARGHGKLYFVTEQIGLAIYLVVIVVGLERYGLAAAGVASLVLYVVHVPMMTVVLAKLIGFRWSRENLWRCAAVFVAAGGVFWIGSVAPIAGAATAVVVAAGFGLFGLRRLDDMNIGGRLGQVIHRTRLLSEMRA